MWDFNTHLHMTMIVKIRHYCLCHVQIGVILRNNYVLHVRI